MDSLIPKSRVCTGCGEEKLLEEFSEQKKGKYGRESRCKVCRQQYYRRYAQENKQKIAEKGKQYYEVNKEKIAEKNKQYYEANKEELAERQIEKIKYLTENDLLPKSRVCTKCGDEKSLEEFRKMKTGKYGRRSQCELCEKQYREANKERSSEYRKQYYQANKEKLLEKSKKHREENKEKINQYRREYYEANKEKMKKQRAERIKFWIDSDLLPKSKTCSKCGKSRLLAEFPYHPGGKYGKNSQCKLCIRQYKQDSKEKISEWSRQYYQDNKEKINEYGKQYRHDNRESYNEWQRNRLKNDEQYRIRRNLSHNLHRTLNKIGKTKNASILTYIGCSIEFMKEHLNSTKKPNWGDDLHIDHIIPSSLFDHTNEEEIKKCWNWRNLRYLPAEENMSKGDTLDMYLVKSYGIKDLLPEGVDK